MGGAGADSASGTRCIRRLASAARASPSANHIEKQKREKYQSFPSAGQREVM